MKNVLRQFWVNSGTRWPTSLRMKLLYHQVKMPPLQRIQPILLVSLDFHWNIHRLRAKYTFIIITSGRPICRYISVVADISVIDQCIGFPDNKNPYRLSASADEKFNISSLTNIKMYYLFSWKWVDIWRKNNFFNILFH